MTGHVVYPQGHPLMRDPMRVRGHARCALARAATGVQSLRRQPSPGEGSASRSQQALMHEIVRSLEMRLRDLEAAYAELEPGRCDDLAGAWQRFFGRYDEFLDALRRCRTEIADARTA